ncbi:MAG: DUF3310 domain-containing protein [Myxococcota bacterium]
MISSQRALSIEDQEAKTVPTLKIDDEVNHPAHYNRSSIEPINVIEAWGLGFCDGNALKYIARAGHKGDNTRVLDLEKAIWYLEREVARLKK